MAQEILRATIPTTNKWHTEDVERKAKELGMGKSEFVLEAVSLLLAFDENTIKEAQEKSKNDYLPIWYHIKNNL